MDGEILYKQNLEILRTGESRLAGNSPVFLLTLQVILPTEQPTSVPKMSNA